MATSLQQEIINLTDLEALRHKKAMEDTPGAYAAYVNEKKGRIIEETVDTKRAAFVKMIGDTGHTLDRDYNSIAALNRTNELADTQEKIYVYQEQQKAAKVQNQDMTRRQVEINNWYYENKRETLFVLQLLLLVVLTLVVALSFVNWGWITQDGGDYLMTGVIVVGLGTWMYRWYFTSKIRDRRYWNQRQFPQDGSVAPPSGQICIGPGGETKGLDAEGSG